MFEIYLLNKYCHVAWFSFSAFNYTLWLTFAHIFNYIYILQYIAEIFQILYMCDKY